MEQIRTLHDAWSELEAIFRENECPAFTSTSQAVISTLLAYIDDLRDLTESEADLKRFK